jgi:hypothetical protein
VLVIHALRAGGWALGGDVGDLRASRWWVARLVARWRCLGFVGWGDGALCLFGLEGDYSGLLVTCWIFDCIASLVGLCAGGGVAGCRTLCLRLSACMALLGKTRRLATLWQPWLLLLWLGCAGGAAPVAQAALEHVEPDHLQPGQYDAAAKAYRNACETGSAQACGYLGFMYDNAFGVRQDLRQAVALSERGCDEGGAYGCAYLGYLFQMGRGVATDAKRAAALFRKACDGSDTSGCLLLGIMYKTGAGVPQDFEYAVQLFGRACDDGETLACVSLGYMYANGEGVDRDEPRAAELFIGACAKADEIGCQAKQQLAGRLPVP